MWSQRSEDLVTEGKVAQQASDEEGTFGKAFLKYSDAVSFASDNYLYHLHVGRFLLLQGKHDEAVKRLQFAVGLKPVNVQSRFYLGLALLQQANKSREHEAIEYVHEGLEHLLYKLTLQAESFSNDPCNQLHSSELLDITNVQSLKGFLTLGKVLTSTAAKLPSFFMKADEVFRLVASLAVRALCSVNHKGELYHQIEGTFLETHSCLLQWMIEMKKKNGAGIQDAVVARHCDNLCSLLKVLSLPKDNALLQLQEKTCQQGVIFQPQNSRALYMLGDAQLSRHDNEINNNNNTAVLEEAEKSYRASLELEGKPSGGKEVPGLIQEQQWWKQRQSAKTKEVTSAKTTSATKENQRVSPTKGSTSRGRGRGATPVKTAATTRCQAKQPAAKPTPVKSSVAAKPSNVKTSRTSAPKQSAPAGKPSAGKTPCRTCSHNKIQNTAKKTPPPTSPSPPTTQPTRQEAVGPPNATSYHPRLGLARVLTRLGSDPDAARRFYEECISMEPNLHDAYIELGEILVESDPLAAVEVYSKYPFPDPLTYDDAFLHGEVARLLTKHEKFDDPRLGPSLIALGKVMGFSVLEKYVDILDSKLKYSKLLMQIYAQVNGKNVDDPDLQQFFKFKCWI